MFDSFVTFHARITPGAVAFVTPDGQVGYAGLDADIDRVAALFLDRLPAGPDGLAAVQLANPYAHWLTLLALARIGVASMSAAPERTPSFLIGDQPGAGLHLSHDLLTATLGTPRPAITPVRPPAGTMARLMLSSGTTGQRRAVALSWGMLQRRAKDYLMTMAGRELRLMTMVGTDTVMGLMSGITAWCGGGVAVFTHGLASLPAELPTLRPTVLSLATGQLSALLGLLPAGVAPRPDLRVTVGGSPVSRALAARTLQLLAGEVSIMYGSTEAGGLSIGRHTMLDVSPDAVGTLYPGQDVEIVDEAGRALPPGAQGEIRVRGEDVATGYLDDPGHPAFRDGWFYPGDIGRLLPDGLLCIAGRMDEVMNLGGVKVLPQVLEDAARACPGVHDAAAFALPAPGGGQRAHVAVVRGEAFDEAALARAMQEAVPGVTPPMLVWVDAIPRNAMAKVDRTALAAAVSIASGAA